MCSNQNQTSNGSYVVIYNSASTVCNCAVMGTLGAVVPLELVVFSGGSLQESVKPQAAATPAALLTIHRY